MTITVYHNPKCSNSRGVLALLAARGITPTIVEYLQTPLGPEALAALAARVGRPLRDLVRAKEPIFAELNLADADDAALRAAMAAHPILLNRPIVVTPRGAALCRPPERVLDLL